MQSEGVCSLIKNYYNDLFIYYYFLDIYIYIGFSGKEMNVPFIKEKAIQLDMAVDKIKTDFNHVLKDWDDKADEMFDGFLHLFHRDASLVRSENKIIQKYPNTHCCHTATILLPYIYYCHVYIYGSNKYGSNIYGSKMYGSNMYSSNMYSSNMCGSNMYVHIYLCIFYYKITIAFKCS